MNFIWDKITEWLKGLLVGGIVSNLSGLFDSINTRVADVASTVGKTPQAWNGSIFSMIKSLSENVVVPIAGIILTFVMCLELIQLLIDRNNMHDFETFIFFKWVFKTFAAVLIVTNTWNIVIQARFVRPRTRVFETENFYATLEQNTRNRREVRKILHGKEKGKA